MLARWKIQVLSASETGSTYVSITRFSILVQASILEKGVHSRSAEKISPHEISCNAENNGISCIVAQRPL